VLSTALNPNLNRRGFLQSLGGGLLVLLAEERSISAQESGGPHRRSSADEIPKDVAAWLHIAPDGAVTAFTGKVEVGQNARTSLTQAVADELRCSPAAVRLVMGDTALVPWDIGTVGSRTTPTMAPQLRKMASTAREALVDAAAAKWSVDRSLLTVANSRVSHAAAGKSLQFSELARNINWSETIGRDDAVTPASKWQVAGTSLPKIDAQKIVTGGHRYTSDFKLAGMLYGQVVRPPTFQATLTSVDASEAASMHGVGVLRDGNFLGVTAPDEHTAQLAVKKIKANWQEKGQISASELFPYLKAHASQSPSRREAAGAVAIAQAPSSSEISRDATYTVAYIAHVPLEPRAAVAQWTDGKLTVWTGTQRPFGVRSELAEALNLPETSIRVIVPDTGSGYGGKHTGECALEAARLAKAAGRPVKLVWTREEEFTWAYFRPAGVIDVRSGMTADGRLTAWEYHNYLSGPSGLPTPYEVPNPSVHYHEADSPLRVGSYRGLAATANHFARESHMDDLAVAAKLDPLEFRLKNLKDERLRDVLEAAAGRFGWKNRTARPGRGYGLAGGMEKGGYVACCAEISVTPDHQIHVERVVEAWECGAVVNPEHLKNQVEGAIVMGIGGALFEAIDFADGRILNSRLSKYRVPRFSDLPQIELVILDRKDLPSAGAGETPIVGIAPAIANALFNATGVRVRSMPLQPALQASRA
jgi:nicotinate dehydrogenase subunit B